MINTKTTMIIANDKIITTNVTNYQYNPQTQQYDVTFKCGKTYCYNYNSVHILKQPRVLNTALYHLKHGEQELFNIAAIYVFEYESKNYWHICFENDTERDYNEGELDIAVSCLDDKTAKNVFKYLKQIASLVSLKADDGTKLLSIQYDKLNFIDTKSSLAPYLNPTKYIPTVLSGSIPVFPFGCNASQFKAVQKALDNQLSVIEGPPGTGKTQTILNIIANLLISGKKVQVVSNNNNATTNILEKLASDKYMMDFIVAPLGSYNNKINFINNQSGLYPNVSSWHDESVEAPDFMQDVRKRSAELNKIFKMQEELAVAKHELNELELEYKYFEKYSNESYSNTTEFNIRQKVSSSNLLRLWQDCQNFCDNNRKLSFLFKLKSRLYYGISNWKFYNQDIQFIISEIQRQFYISKQRELRKKITALRKLLRDNNSEELTKQFTNLSMRLFKNTLYKLYGEREERIVFKEEDFINHWDKIQSEYPIVLSTTFSSRSSLSRSAFFDYVIMDEASQVDVSTAALALSCAQNAVIVGDTKQLPNVVEDDIKKRADAIFNSFNINKNYSYAHNSFLQSLCGIIPDIPRTLLREHYRCHPKIIEFCNQKFYGGELIIMTNDNGEYDTLSVIRTAKGNHARDKMNQRQIDIVHDEILPKLQCRPEEIGIVAPYNNQVNAMRKAIDDTTIDVATVHKFQGREKDAIIITTVDNKVNDFVDDPYLLNVAISRAKKKLYIVVSGNDIKPDSNIADLISYIEYNNFSMTDSKIYSVFDYLYSQYTESRLEFLKNHQKVSDYDSENLMYILIQETLKEMDLINLGVICHQPLNMLIRDPKLLNQAECNYAMNNATHLDFLIYNRIGKTPVLAIEVDGYHYHKSGTAQSKRDAMKDHILDLYSIEYLRFLTNGSGEKQKLRDKLTEIIPN